MGPLEQLQSLHSRLWMPGKACKLGWQQRCCSLGSRGLTGSEGLGKVPRHHTSLEAGRNAHMYSLYSCLIWKKLGQGKKKSGYGQVKSFHVMRSAGAAARMLIFVEGAGFQRISQGACWGNQKHVTRGMGKTGHFGPGEHCGDHESCLWTRARLAYGRGVKLVL